jgi:hypothetical protein
LYRTWPVYLGHVSPRETYWYLSASPELLNAAARSFETFTQSKGCPMNKPSRPLLVGPLLQSFFSEHLCSHKDASIQTIASYRDTFRLLLSYVQQTAGIEPSALRITDLEVTVILAFLAHLEE